MSKLIKIATRESPLALWQAHYVRDQLLARHSDLRVDIVGMTTRGDQLLDSPLAKVGGKGLFVKELEVAMLDGRADIAVHSMKDVPMEFPSGLGIRAICPRENPHDALVSNQYSSINALPMGAVVGTSSLRRQLQLKALRPDVQVADLRGNVNTRLRKLDEGQYDAIILACAGLIRLGFEARIASQISDTQLLPSVGQGAVGIECRTADVDTQHLLNGLHHPSTALCVRAERAMNTRLNGGCQVPIAGYAQLQGEQIWLRGLVGSPSGSPLLRAEARGSAAEPERLGQCVAEQLLEQGAAAILREAGLQ